MKGFQQVATFEHIQALHPSGREARGGAGLRSPPELREGGEGGGPHADHPRPRPRVLREPHAVPRPPGAAVVGEGLTLREQNDTYDPGARGKVCRYGMVYEPRFFGTIAMVDILVFYTYPVEPF